LAKGGYTCRGKFFIETITNFWYSVLKYGDDNDANAFSTKHLTFYGPSAYAGRNRRLGGRLG
jgi:hypothetical protein